MTEKDIVQIAFLIAAILAASCGNEGDENHVPDANTGGGESDTDIDAGTIGDMDGGPIDDTDTNLDTDSSSDTGADAGGDSDVDADTVDTDDTTDTADGGDTDSSFDTGDDTDSLVDSDTLPTCDGGLFDQKSNLCWQNPPIADQMDWESAMAYCEDLEHGGHTDWRVPSIKHG